MLEYWLCDTCGGKIESLQDGLIEWVGCRHNGKGIGRNLRLVHCSSANPQSTRECSFDPNIESSRDGGVVYDHSLRDMAGPDRLMLLLEFLYEDKLPKNEVLEMIKRVHIPGYEIARHHVDDAIAQGVFEPDRPKGFYSQNDIQLTLEYMASSQV